MHAGAPKPVALARVPGGDVAAALALVEHVATDPQLAGYPWLPSVRGDLLQRLGRLAEARVAFLDAAARAGNAPDRALMAQRAAQCGPP